ncbi:MAG: hypothetical protein QXR48_04265 [Candidatus Woesearchaeota archaeon]
MADDTWLAEHDKGAASKRLILYGFCNKKKLEQKYPGWSKLSEERKKEILRKMSAGEAEELADHDTIEIQRDQIMTLPYPKPRNKYYFIYEVPHESVEPVYYWLLGHMTYDWGYPIVHKITDIFTAAEHSSFYGASAQRLGLAQDKVAQYLATIGKMIKDMFQLVRELRWIDERKKYYEDAEAGKEGAEIALKGLWTDMVDGVVGGQRTSSNLFVMAQQLNFSALPDLFFSIHVTKQIVAKLKGKSIKEVKEEEVRAAVDGIVEKQAGGFNKELKNVLKRKLYQYLVWKEETWLEIKQRRKFTLDYLRQHYHIIKMYMSWVKPYIAHIKKLGADITKMSSAELIAAFEGSLVEIEVLGQKIPEGNKKAYSCVLLTLQYRTRPEMQFAQEGGYHRGPLHQGETKVFIRAYGWTEEQIEQYKKMKDEEDFELISSIDNSLKAAMEALGDDLKRYLKESEEMHKEEKKEKKEEPRKLDLFEPFKALGKSFGETFTAIIPKKEKKSAIQEKEKLKKELDTAAKDAAKTIWQIYKNFKKAHRMLAW